MNLIKRETLKKEIIHRIKTFRITALVGARQTGKTTLAKIIGEEMKSEGEVHYFDLESAADLELLKNTPEFTLGKLKGLIIIDEIHRNPEFFQILRVLSDRVPLPARFLVLGSASGSLLKQTSESLAGRINYLEISGFKINEIKSEDQEKLWLRGSFPESFLAENDSQSFLWREQFIRTFLERDIPSYGMKTEPMQLWRFLMMAAHYHGQVWNHSEIGRSLQVNDKTIKHYLDLFTDIFITRQLLPWFENVGKRVIKSPKFYIRDSGILHQLLNIKTREELWRHPKLGTLWEGFALEQIIQLSKGHPFVFFWATQSGGEMDLFMIHNGKRIGFEIKYADAHPVTKSIQNTIQDLKLDKVYMVYPGSHRGFLRENIELMPLSQIENCFDEFK